jgi:hypothetical protein
MAWHAALPTDTFLIRFPAVFWFTICVNTGKLYIIGFSRGMQARDEKDTRRGRSALYTGVSSYDVVSWPLPDP